MRRARRCDWWLSQLFGGGRSGNRARRYGASAHSVGSEKLPNRQEHCRHVSATLRCAEELCWGIGLGAAALESTPALCLGPRCCVMSLLYKAAGIIYGTERPSGRKVAGKRRQTDRGLVKQALSESGRRGNAYRQGAGEAGSPEAQRLAAGSPKNRAAETLDAHKLESGSGGPGGWKQSSWRPRGWKPASWGLRGRRLAAERPEALRSQSGGKWRG